MGEIADDCFDRAMDELYEGRHYDEDYSPFTGRQPKGRRDKVPADRYYKGNTHKKGAKKGKPQPFIVEYPSKITDPALLPSYPEKTFDMGFFPKPVAKPPEPSVWGINEDDAPF